MFTVFSRHGLRMDDFATLEAAMDALNRWFDSLFILQGGKIVFDKRDKIGGT